MTQIAHIRALNTNAVMLAAVMVAVAAASLSFGRWVVPAGGSGHDASVGATTTHSAAARIAERKYESGVLDSLLFGDAKIQTSTAASHATSAAEAIAIKKYESGRIDSLLFGEDATALGSDTSAVATSSPPGPAAAETIAQRKYESGKLDEILFGD